EDDVWRIYDLDDGAEFASLPFPGQPWADAVLSDDRRRLIVVRQTGEGDDRLYEAMQWNLDAGEAVWRRTQSAVGAPPPRATSLPAGVFVLRSTRLGEGGHRSSLEVFRWGAAEAAWAIEDVGFPQSFAVDRAGARMLVQRKTGLELRAIATGDLLWRREDIGASGLAFGEGDGPVAVTVLQGDRKTLAALDPASGETLWESEIAVAYALGAASDGSRFIVGGDDEAGFVGLQGFDAATGELAFELPTDATPSDILPLRDPGRVLVEDSGGMARVFDLATGDELRRLVFDNRADREAFAPLAPRAATSAGASVRFWNSETGEEIAAITAAGPLLSLAISPDGAKVAMLSRGEPLEGIERLGALEIWSPESDAPVAAVSIEAASTVVFDPTGRMLALIGRTEEPIRVLDAANFRTLLAIRPLARGAFSTLRESLRFTPDGAHIAVLETGDYGQSDQNDQRVSMRVFSVGERREVARVDFAPFRAGSGVAATSEGFVYTGVDGRARLLALPRPPLDPVFPTPGWRLSPLGASPRVLGWGYADGASILDPANGIAVALRAPSEEVSVATVAVDRAGGHVALSLIVRDEGDGLSGRMEVYDAATGRLVAETATPRYSEAVAFDADGGRLLFIEEVRFAELGPDWRGELLSWSWREPGARPEPISTDSQMRAVASAAGAPRVATKEGARDNDTREPYGPMRTRLFDLESGEIVASRDHDLTEPRILLSEDGRRLAILSTSSPVSGEVI
ncbi:MAG: PQQ-binding-like beta-propeller repeat protein, partial [Pseudomonadota bacterium]